METAEILFCTVVTEYRITMQKRREDVSADATKILINITK